MLPPRLILRPSRRKVIHCRRLYRACAASSIAQFDAVRSAQHRFTPGVVLLLILIDPGRYAKPALYIDVILP